MQRDCGVFTDTVVIGTHQRVRWLERRQVVAQANIMMDERDKFFIACVVTVAAVFTIIYILLRVVEIIAAVDRLD